VTEKAATQRKHHVATGLGWWQAG